MGVGHNVGNPFGAIMGLAGCLIHSLIMSFVLAVILVPWMAFAFLGDPDERSAVEPMTRREAAEVMAEKFGDTPEMWERMLRDFEQDAARKTEGMGRSATAEGK